MLRHRHLIIDEKVTQKKARARHGTFQARATTVRAQATKQKTLQNHLRRCMIIMTSENWKKNKKLRRCQVETHFLKL